MLDEPSRSAIKCLAEQLRDGIDRDIMKEYRALKEFRMASPTLLEELRRHVEESSNAEYRYNKSFGFVDDYILDNEEFDPDDEDLW